MDDYFIVEYHGRYGGTPRAVVFARGYQHTIDHFLRTPPVLTGMTRDEAERVPMPAFVHRKDCVVMSRDDLAAYIAMVQAAEAMR